jgi:hypothetical protein
MTTFIILISMAAFFVFSFAAVIIFLSLLFNFIDMLDNLTRGNGFKRSAPIFPTATPQQKKVRYELYHKNNTNYKQRELNSKFY